MRKSLSSSPADRRPGLSGAKGPDRKKLVLIGISIAIGILILIVLASVAFSVLGNRGAGNATPVPTVTPEPTTEPEPTPTPAPTPSPSPVPATGQVFSNDGPFFMNAFLKGSTGEARVMLTLSPGAAIVNVSKLTISVVCDGQTYDNVWSLKLMDWSKTDNDAILEYDEGIVADIDTVKLGIPQGKPLTIKVLKNGDLMQQVAVAPTYT